VRNRIITVVLTACISLSLMGCLVIGTTTRERPLPPPTVGQELLDLQAALESGAISQEEFDRAKRALIGSAGR
jgi:hypothetical protein